MITIKDIAHEAGVSITTVSNVIHGAKSRVSPETVERVQGIIEKYHYRPNMSARALVSGNSRIVALINHVEQENVASLPEDSFLAQLIRILEHELSVRQYYMMVKTVSTEEELLSIYSNWNLAGLIINGVFEGTFFRQLKKNSFPCVLVDSYIKKNPFHNIGLEDQHGAYIATEYLIKKGHRHIAFASPMIYDSGVVHERFVGYCNALADAGIAQEEKNVYQVSRLDMGFALGQKLAARSDITAIFATADLLALGIMAGLQRSGVRIPDDKSVFGFDDMFESHLFNPSLTTIRQDIQKKGAVAVETLINIIEGKKVSKNIILPVEVVERESVRDILALHGKTPANDR